MDKKTGFYLIPHSRSIDIDTEEDLKSLKNLGNDEVKEIKTLGIIWDQHLWGGVDSHLAYLLNSRAFEKIDVTIFTNIDNQGLLRLEKL